MLIKQTNLEQCWIDCAGKVTLCTKTADRYPPRAHSISLLQIRLKINRKIRLHKKALNSVDRNNLWRLLRHYGISEKFISLIWIGYEGMHCTVIHVGKLLDPFEVKTGVRQGCILSHLLFLPVINWVMRSVTEDRRMMYSGHHGNSRMIWIMRMTLLFYCIPTVKSTRIPNCLQRFQTKWNLKSIC